MHGDFVTCPCCCLFKRHKIQACLLRAASAICTQAGFISHQSADHLKRSHLHSHLQGHSFEASASSQLHNRKLLQCFLFVFLAGKNISLGGVYAVSGDHFLAACDEETNLNLSILPYSCCKVYSVPAMLQTQPTGASGAVARLKIHKKISYCQISNKFTSRNFKLICYFPPK